MATRGSTMPFLVLFLAITCLAEENIFRFTKNDQLTDKMCVGISTTSAEGASCIKCAALCTRQTWCTGFFCGSSSQLCEIPAVFPTSTAPSTLPTYFYQLDTNTGLGECPVDVPGVWYNATADLCFKVSNYSVNSWEAAVSACRTDGMELIKLDTYARQAAVMETLRDNPEWATRTQYSYIGAARPKEFWGNSSQPDIYYWLDGTEVVWGANEYWGPGQPNGLGFEECVSVQGSDLHIYDRRVDDISTFICQIDT